MNDPLPRSYTSFHGHRQIASGPLLANALAARRALLDAPTAPVLTFDDETGRTTEIDTRGTEAEVSARLAASAGESPGEATDAAPARGRGRPKLGVVPREVTLLPRHWEWLAEQPGGASVVLRRLVEDARRAGGEKNERRRAQERAYHFLSAIAGDLPGFEEASRALFAGDAAKLRGQLATWPADVRNHAMRLAFGEA